VLGLCLEELGRDLEWWLSPYEDSDWAGDQDQRLSITRLVIYLMGAPVLWKSRAQKNITLSSTEAENVSLSEFVAEIMFIKQILELLGLKVKYPIYMNIDIVSMIFLANNEMAGQKMKHIDVHSHYVCEFIEDGVVKIVFVKSVENQADIFTKNTNINTFEGHVNKMMGRSLMMT